MYFFSILNINFNEVFFITFFILDSYKNFIKFRSTSIHSKLFTGSFWDIAQPYIIYIPILKIWRFFIFIIIFHVFVISFCRSINRVTYSYSNTFFCHNISISIKRSNFTLMIFLILEVKEILQEQVNIFMTHILKLL